MWRKRTLTLAAAVMLWAQSGLAGSAGLSAEDVAAVSQANQAYVDAWLANDPERVMGTLSDDAVLIPHHGVDPVIGSRAIREFWFPPDSPPTEVSHMVNTITEILGSGDLAVVWGRSELEFTYDGATYKNEGNYLAVLKRGDDGRWRIARRIWNDPVAVVN